MFNITYKKQGGLHFWTIGRLGGSFYLKRAIKLTELTEFLIDRDCWPTQGGKGRLFETHNISNSRSLNGKVL